MSTEKKPGRGRQSTYDETVALEICRRHFEGESIREIFQEIKVPARGTFYIWLENNKELQDHYRRAREGFADFQHDRILELAKSAKDCTYFDREGNKRVDQGGVKAVEVEIHAIQWIIGRAHPRKYGMKPEDITGPQETQLPQITIEPQPKLSKPLK